MKTPTKCPYCQKPMRIFKDTEYTRTTFEQCDYHGAVRVRYNDLGTGGYVISLVVLYKEQQYAMKFYHDIPMLTNNFQVHLVRRWPHTSDIVMSLDFHPPITPENAAQKLPTMILFS